MYDKRTLKNLDAIYDYLPMHAEEGGEAFSVNMREKVINQNAEAAELSITVDLVERMFTCLGVLDETLLEHGIWRFKSFPASLMARSVLSSLKDENQNYLILVCS